VTHSDHIFAITSKDVLVNVGLVVMTSSNGAPLNPLFCTAVLLDCTAHHIVQQ